MLRQRKAKKRFSLLLLDEDEEYEGDWVGFLQVPDQFKRDLKVASSSSSSSTGASATLDASGAVRGRLG